MEISFECPMFFVIEDEDTFFKWLYSLPAYENVVGQGSTLHLSLNEPVDSSTVEQLLVIFRRWCIEIDALVPLKSTETADCELWDTELKVASQPFLGGEA